MALQTLAGMPIPIGKPSGYADGTAPAFGSSSPIDATGEKLAFTGRVVWNGGTAGATKDISRVGFRFGAVTKAGGSALTVSLQDVATGAGPAMQPDGTQDQTVAIANADASFASNTWIRTGTLSANRTVTYGDLVAVVIEFDGGGRLGADSVIVTGLGLGGVTSLGHGLATTHTTDGTTWATNQPLVPNVVLEFSGGDFGTLFGAFPVSAISTVAYNSGTGGADEYALEFSFPGPVKIAGIGGVWQHASASADADCVCYDGTSAMSNGTVTAYGDHASAVTTGDSAYEPFPGILSLSAGTTYRLAVKPTSANSVTLYYFDVADANHFTCHTGGTGWCLTSRVDAGSWASATATRRPFLWPYVCAIDDGASAGGGLITHPGMVGGMRG